MILSQTTITIFLSDVFFNQRSLTEEFSEEQVDVELSKAEGTSSSEEKQCGMHCGTSNKDALKCTLSFSL